MSWDRPSNRYPPNQQSRGPASVVPQQNNGGYPTGPSNPHLNRPRPPGAPSGPSNPYPPSVTASSSSSSSSHYQHTQPPAAPSSWDRRRASPPRQQQQLPPHQQGAGSQDGGGDWNSYRQPPSQPSQALRNVREAAPHQQPTGPSADFERGGSNSLEDRWNRATSSTAPLPPPSRTWNTSAQARSDPSIQRQPPTQPQQDRLRTHSGLHQHHQQQQWNGVGNQPGPQQGGGENGFGGAGNRQTPPSGPSGWVVQNGGAGAYVRALSGPGEQARPPPPGPSSYVREVPPTGGRPPPTAPREKEKEPEPQRGRSKEREKQRTSVDLRATEDGRPPIPERPPRSPGSSRSRPPSSRSISPPSPPPRRSRSPPPRSSRRRSPSRSPPRRRSRSPSPSRRSHRSPSNTSRAGGGASKKSRRASFNKKRNPEKGSSYRPASRSPPPRRSRRSPSPRSHRQRDSRSPRPTHRRHYSNASGTSELSVVDERSSHRDSGREKENGKERSRSRSKTRRNPPDSASKRDRSRSKEEGASHGRTEKRNRVEDKAPSAHTPPPPAALKAAAPTGPRRRQASPAKAVPTGPANGRASGSSHVFGPPRPPMSAAERKALKEQQEPIPPPVVVEPEPEPVVEPECEPIPAPPPPPPEPMAAISIRPTTAPTSNFKLNLVSSKPAARNAKLNKFFSVGSSEEDTTTQNEKAPSPAPAPAPVVVKKALTPQPDSEPEYQIPPSPPKIAPPSALDPRGAPARWERSPDRRRDYSPSRGEYRDIDFRDDPRRWDDRWGGGGGGGNARRYQPDRDREEDRWGDRPLHVPTPDPFGREPRARSISPGPGPEREVLDFRRRARMSPVPPRVLERPPYAERPPYDDRPLYDDRHSYDDRPPPPREWAERFEPPLQRYDQYHDLYDSPYSNYPPQPPQPDPRDAYLRPPGRSPPPYRPPPPDSASLDYGGDAAEEEPAPPPKPARSRAALSDRSNPSTPSRSTFPIASNPPPSSNLQDAPSAASTPLSVAVEPTPAPAPISAPPPPSATSTSGHNPRTTTNGKPSTEMYEKLVQVGEGTYGKVYKARNNETGSFVALKRIRMEGEKDGFPVTAMREIKLLQSLQHVNVVRLYEMMVSNGSVYMVFEYMDHDLTGVLSQPQYVFSPANLKSLCHQMILGLEYLHFKGVLHRDMKGSNILINAKGELKLADFGLARFYHKRRRSDYTNRVITLWYRPPELLLGATEYGPEVDMWSAGCIMLELFTRKTTFPGNDEIHQLETIYDTCGTPEEAEWLGLTELPWYELLRKQSPPLSNRLREVYEDLLSPAAMDLAENLLTYDPTKRISATDALKSDYFLIEDPPMEIPAHLAEVGGEFHELEAKREKAKKRAKTRATEGDDRSKPKA